MMPGVAIGEIREAIIDAYSPEELSETLRILMDVRLYAVTPSAEFEHQVFKLVDWADRMGRDVELVRAVAKARPRKAKIQEIYGKYGMAVPVYVENAGAQVPDSPTYGTDGGLEKLVKPHLTFAEFGIWRERILHHPVSTDGKVCKPDHH